MKIGDKVKVEKVEWGFVGRVCKRVDVIGEITSIKGQTPNHPNIHKFEITLPNGTRVYSNNKKNTGDYLFTKIKTK